MDPVEEITRHLDKTDDGTLLILRTHLLVEERLRDVLARICRAPDETGAARARDSIPTIARLRILDDPLPTAEASATEVVSPALPLATSRS